VELADGGEIYLQWTCELSAWCVPSVEKFYYPVRTNIKFSFLSKENNQLIRGGTMSFLSKENNQLIRGGTMS
jgi:hypothetical protein